MLTLIGLGLWDEKDITLRGLEAAKAADAVYVETYTDPDTRDVRALERLVGKSVTPLARQGVEEGSGKIVAEAKGRDVAILVGGDPLVFTTHAELVAEARRAGVETRIIHNASIFSAIGETGLHVYKFGKSVTVPFPDKVADPRSVYDAIKDNASRGLHTLLVLDLDKGRCMTPREAVDIMMRLEEKYGENVLSPKTKVVVFSNAGSDEPEITYAEIQSIAKMSAPSAIVVPGELHFTEKRFLESLA